MIISDTTIRNMNEGGILIQQEISDIQLQPNSVDLTLGNTWKRIKPNISPCGIGLVDPASPMCYEEGIINPTGFVILPGDFILMASNEILNIPNGVVGIVCGRSSIARMGIITENAGFVDSGFNGTITFEVSNQLKHPVILYPGMRIAQVYFLKSEHSERLYGKEKGSKYNGQIDATGSQVHLDPELQGRS